jgi:phosphoribosyl 1,2-cyclic phosphate phosphodiesterase
MRMKITILGSGTSTGVPMVGCHCPVCTSSDPKDTRTRASILIETAGKFILVDTSPDLRRQALAQAIPHIDAVLFTHTHSDHINGIDDLRGFHLLHKRVIPCYGSKETLDQISVIFLYLHRCIAGGYTPYWSQIRQQPVSAVRQTILPVPWYTALIPPLPGRRNGLPHRLRIPDTMHLSGLDIRF